MLPRKRKASNKAVNARNLKVSSLGLSLPTPPPHHICKHCGKDLLPPVDFLKFWNEAKNPFERGRLNPFYRCDCSPWDCQVLTKEERAQMVPAYV